MKITEFRQKSKEELAALMREKQSYLSELRFLLRQKKTKNVKETCAVRKDIARIQTILNSH